MLRDGQIGLVQQTQRFFGVGKFPLGSVDKPAQRGAVNGKGQNAELRFFIQLGHHVVHGVHPLLGGPGLGVPAEQMTPRRKALALWQKVPSQLAQHLLQRVNGQRPSGNPIAEQVLKQGSLLVFSDHPVVAQLLVGAGVFHPGDGPGHRGLNLVIAGRLQDVVKAAQLNGLLGIEKVGVRGEKHADKIHALVSGPAQQGKAVFPGHFNVAQQDVHRLLRKNFLGLGGAAGGADGGDSQGVPVQPGNKTA